LLSQDTISVRFNLKFILIIMEGLSKGYELTYLLELEHEFDERMMFSTQELNKKTPIDKMKPNPKCVELTQVPNLDQSGFTYDVVYPYEEVKAPPIKWVAPMWDVRVWEQEVADKVDEKLTMPQIMQLRCSVSHVMGTMRGHIIHNSATRSRRHTEIYSACADFINLLSRYKVLVVGDLKTTLCLRTGGQQTYISAQGDWDLEALGYAKPEHFPKLINFPVGTAKKSIELFDVSTFDLVLFAFRGDKHCNQLRKKCEANNIPTVAFGMSLDHSQFLEVKRQKKNSENELVDRTMYYFYGKRLDFLFHKYVTTFSHSVIFAPSNETCAMSTWSFSDPRVLWMVGHRYVASGIPMTIDLPRNGNYYYSEKLDGEVCYVDLKTVNNNFTKHGDVKNRKLINGSDCNIVWALIDVDLPMGAYIGEVMHSTTEIHISQPLMMYGASIYLHYFEMVKFLLSRTNGLVGTATSLLGQVYAVRLKPWFHAVHDGPMLNCDSDNPALQGFNISAAAEKEGIILIDAYNTIGACDFITGKMKYYFWKRPIYVNFEDYISESDGNTCIGNLGSYRIVRDRQFKPNYNGPGVYSVNFRGDIECRRPEKTMGDSLFYKEAMWTMLTVRNIQVNMKVNTLSSQYRYDQGVMKIFPDYIDVSDYKVDKVPDRNFKVLLYDLPGKNIYVGSVVKHESSFYLVTKLKQDVESSDYDGRVRFVLRYLNRRHHFVPMGVL